MNTARSLAQLHAGAVVHDRTQPSGHLRPALELVDVGICGEEPVLHSVLGIGCVAKKSECPSVKRRQAIWQDVLQRLSWVLINEKFATLESLGVRILHSVVLARGV